MKGKIDEIVKDVGEKTPEWLYYESHTFENALVDEGEYVKVEDVWKALREVANRVSKLYIVKQ